MSVRVNTPYERLEIGNFIVGKGDVIWKVTHKRDDGHLGIQNQAGDRKILKPALIGTSMVQVIYGFTSLEEMQAAAEKQVADQLGGAVVARKIEPGDWQMPSLYELYAPEGERTLRAHLAVAHGATLCGPEATMEDLRTVHDTAHQMAGEDAGHRHENGVSE